jgi:hypothetical protein
MTCGCPRTNFVVTAALDKVGRTCEVFCFAPTDHNTRRPSRCTGRGGWSSLARPSLWLCLEPLWVQASCPRARQRQLWVRRLWLCPSWARALPRAFLSAGFSSSSSAESARHSQLGRVSFGCGCFGFALLGRGLRLSSIVLLVVLVLELGRVSFGCGCFGFALL